MLQKNKKQKGSTFILVIAILSVLALISITISYTSQLEVLSASNFAQNVQARLAAASGLSSAVSLFAANPKYTTYTQRWANAKILTTKTATTLSTSSEFENSTLRLSAPAEIAEMTIVDESGKININACGSIPNEKNPGVSTFETALSNVIDAALKKKNLDHSKAETIAKKIIEYRYGPDGKPGAAGKDDDGDFSTTDLTIDGIDNDKDGIVDNVQERKLGVNFDKIDNNQDSFVDDGHDGIDNDKIDNDADGTIDEANEGIDEPDEFISDIRIAPNGDDRPYYSLEQLKKIPEITPEIYSAIAPYLTIFSATTEIIPYGIKDITSLNFSASKNDPRIDNPVSEVDKTTGEKLVKPLDVNTASLDEMVAYFQSFFPDKNKYLLQQFAVNIIDARDNDDLPTIVDESAINPIIGNEITPYINEVWSDSLSDDDTEGDDGQYIELYNPYPETIDLHGWALTAGTTVYLNTSIPPDGYIIITDDYDGSNDPTTNDDTKGEGSFYDIFGIVRGGSNAQIIEERNLEVSNDSGTIFLKDAQGNLIDYFNYTAGKFQGVKESFQRIDPRIRYSEKKPCTPLARNSNATPPTSGKESMLNTPQNRLFTSPIELMKVYSGFYDKDNNTMVQWAYPQINANDKNSIDSKITDLFYVPIEDNAFTYVQDDKQLLKSTGNEDEVVGNNFAEKTVIGKININTAPYEVLMGLPGMNETLAGEIVKYRMNSEVQSTKNKNEEAVPFQTISDIVRNDSLWNGYTTDQRLDAFSKFENLITVRSRAFSITTKNYKGYGSYAEQPSPEENIFAIIATDNKNNNIINWSYGSVNSKQ